MIACERCPPHQNTNYIDVYLCHCHWLVYFDRILNDHIWFGYHEWKFKKNLDRKKYAKFDYIFLYLTLSLSLSLSIFLCLFFSLYLCIFVSVSLFVSLFLFVCLSYVCSLFLNWLFDMNYIITIGIGTLSSFQDWK